MCQSISFTILLRSSSFIQNFKYKNLKFKYLMDNKFFLLFFIEVYSFLSLDQSVFDVGGD